MWTDLHCHLNFLEITPEEAVKRALEKNVTRMITIGTEPEDHEIVFALANQFSPNVFCTLGVHPHEAKKYDDICERWLKDHFNHPRVVAVGEVGLDYFYDQSPRDIQKNVFRRQLELAIEYNLPVQIHTREAEEDTVSLLKEFNGKVTGVIHCFTSSQFLADEVINLGLNISISGIVTFKNAEALRDVIVGLPLDRIHVETDAPFLTPVPFRGKKNEPAFVVNTAEFVANLKNVSVGDLAKITNENANRVFKKLI